MNRVYLRIWRSVDVNIRLGFLLLGRWVYDCGVTFFLFGRRIDSRCLLLARGEQPQHSQQVNRFSHTT